MSKTPPINRLGNARATLWGILWITVSVCGVKVWISILSQYHWYFPPNFDEAEFLIGRRESFVGIYRVAFYVHIVTSPIALAFMTMQVITANAVLKTGAGWLAGLFRRVRDGTDRVRQFLKWHRRFGKLALLLVAFGVAPSGLVMAWRTFFGAIAAWGFTAQSIATLVSALLSFHFARVRLIDSHRFWSITCWLLLCGPLVFRLTSGFAHVMEFESEWVYRVNAWTSWTLLPLLWFLARYCCKPIGDQPRGLASL